MIMPAYFVFHNVQNHYMTGRNAQFLQRSRWLYRKGNYGVQAMANSNPDNFWDKRHYCWTTDPQCGLEIGPKRPWEDLVDPTKNLTKLQRDATRNAKADKGGFHGM